MRVAMRDALHRCISYVYIASHSDSARKYNTKRAELTTINRINQDFILRILFILRIPVSSSAPARRASRSSV